MYALLADRQMLKKRKTAAIATLDLNNRFSKKAVNCHTTYLFTTYTAPSLLQVVWPKALCVCGGVLRGNSKNLKLGCVVLSTSVSRYMLLTLLQVWLLIAGQLLDPEPPR